MFFNFNHEFLLKRDLLLRNYTYLGPGTYVLNGYVYSSLAGFLHLVPKANDQKQNNTEKEDNSMSVEVHAPGEETAVPSISDIVTAKVTSVNAR